jgi:hypothetical protein
VLSLPVPVVVVPELSTLPPAPAPPSDWALVSVIGALCEWACRETDIVPMIANENAMTALRVEGGFIALV